MLEFDPCFFAQMEHNAPAEVTRDRRKCLAGKTFLEATKPEMFSWINTVRAVCGRETEPEPGNLQIFSNSPPNSHQVISPH
jgi:hypothetical protein